MTPCDIRAGGNESIPLRDLLGNLSREDPETERSMRDLVDALRRHLSMEVAFIGELTDRQRILRVVAAQGPDGPRSGRADPEAESHCAQVVEGRLPEILGDISEHPTAAGLQAVRDLEIAAYIEVPLRLPGGELYGTLCCYDRTENNSLGERDLALMRAVAEVLGERIARRRKEDQEAYAFRAALTSTLGSDAIQVAWQPIVRVNDRQPIGNEALARFPEIPQIATGEMFMMARRLTPDLNLDMQVLERVLAQRGKDDGGQLRFINAWPELLTESRFFDLIKRAGKDVVIELVEDPATIPTEMLKQAAMRVRRYGLRVAIDDVGTGHSNLARLVEICPDYIKLDRSLIREIDRDPAKQALVATFVSFSERIGGQIVAEGVERAAELEVLADLRVPLAQGFYIGRPTL